jgi:hypothetical protein
MVVPGGGTELAACVGGRWIAIIRGGEVHLVDVFSQSVERVTNGGRGSHWPEWAGDGKRLSYSRIFRFYGQPDSLSGLRVLDVEERSDRAIMRTATRPWYSNGPASWMPGDTTLAFFDADSVVGGRRRLVIVPVGGGEGRTVAWIDGGVPGRVSCGSGGDVLYFDNTPRECLVAETQRRTYVVHMGTGIVRQYEYELGDASAQFGYPFRVSTDGTSSVHVGAFGDVGVVAVSDVASGAVEYVTTP